MRERFEEIFEKIDVREMLEQAGKRNKTLSSVISIDEETETIGFYVMPGGDRNAIQYNLANYKPRPFDEEFFNRFEKLVKLYREKFPQVDLQKIALVLPDRLFLTDTVNVPVMNSRAMRHALDLTIESTYKNMDQLKLNSFPMAQNKQFATYGLIGIRKELLQLAQKACAANNVSISGVTFAANAMACGAAALNPKLKNGTYLLLDIKEGSARFAFVVKGRTVGYYGLPFGYSMLYKSRLAAEDLLFDHSAAELLVLNAKERARAKQLTMGADGMESASVAEDEDEDSEKSFTVRESTPTTYEVADGKLKKTARKLPKFMQRPTPQSREEYVFENFRIFVKWALDLLANNAGMAPAGAMDTVYVNMPEEYAFLFDMINAEQGEHKVTFAPLLKAEVSEKIAANLELFGGFYVHQHGKNNTF